MHTQDFGAYRFLFFLGGLLLFLVMEWLIPYRPPTVSKFKRWVINLAISLMNSLVLKIVFASATGAISLYVTTRGLGLLNLLALPYWAKVMGGVMFLDLTLYVWHLLNHEMPVFWRFHRVHHTDLNLDVSTANRFHIGELMISAVIKMAWIYLMGIDLFTIALYESVVVLTSQFHHSSLRVPGWFESLFWPLFVPPSMHRIHHSVVIQERNRNYGTILSLWDRIFGTFIKDVDQKGIRIGVGGHFDAKGLNFHHLLIMPFWRSVR